MNLPFTRQCAKSSPQFSDLMNKATHCHLVIIGIYIYIVTTWDSGFCLDMERSISPWTKECFNLLPVSSSIKFQPEYRLLMSNPYVNNQYKRGINYHYPIAFFFFLEMICYSVLSFPTILMGIQLGEEKCFLFSLSLPFKTAQLISRGRHPLEQS